MVVTENPSGGDDYMEMDEDEVGGGRRSGLYENYRLGRKQREWGQARETQGKKEKGAQKGEIGYYRKHHAMTP